MRVGQIFRYAADRDPGPKIVDGYPNFFYSTQSPGHTRAMLERGINPIASVKAPDGERVPAIVLSSSPHKIGSADTPWQDFFEPDEGHVRYFGDAKVAGSDPATASGNAVLLAAKRLQDTMDQVNRRSAPPIILFRRAKVNGRVKGYPAFQGFGVIERVELVAQYDAKQGTSFPNFVYDIAVLDLSAENEEFDWRWISDRRNDELRVSETERFAPKSWVQWVQSGSQSISRLKRRVTKLMTTPAANQRPPKGSREAQVLQTILRFYDGRKHRFELLAARLAGRILEADGGNFRFGWVTPPSSDGGADFVGRLDVGSGFSKVKQVVFGQAKCELPTSTTSGKDVARTAARLRRGWIGAYVTLGAFSESVQREVIDDEYPILLVPGERVARELITAVIDRRPEEILRE